MNELPASPSSKIIGVVQREAWIDGYAFLAAAKREAASILAKATQDSDQQRSEGFEAGRTAGELDIARLLSDTTTKVDLYLSGLEEDIIDLVLQIVERIVGQMDEIDVAVAIARQAIRHLRHERNLTINVSTAASEAIEHLVATEFTDTTAFPIKIVADPNLEIGRCVLTTPAAVLDTALDGQLSAVRAALLAARAVATPSSEWEP